MKIFYLCLDQGDVELHIAQPENELSNSNQYLVHFGGLIDYNHASSSIAIIGDREFDAFIECLTLVSEYMGNGASQFKKTFRSKNMGIVSLEFLKKHDQPNKIRLKFVFDQQTPLMNGSCWQGIGDNEFAFYVSEVELKNIGKIVSRLVGEEHKYDEITSSSREDWICPSELSHPKDLVSVNKLLEFAKSRVSSVAPEGIVQPWLDLLDRICDYNVEITKCTSCKGLFTREVKWKKQCLGCYRGREPSAIQESSLSEVTLFPWLSLPQ